MGYVFQDDDRLKLFAHLYRKKVFSFGGVGLFQNIFQESAGLSLLKTDTVNKTKGQSRYQN